MGVGKATFASGGQISQHLRPGAYSRLDYVSGAGGSTSINNGVLMGESQGGKPNVLYGFSNYTEAKGTLIGGDLLEAIFHAFTPGGGYVPQTVYAMRVNPGTQSGRTLQASTVDIIDITSVDYGIQTNQIKMIFKAGSTTGYQVTIDYATDDQYFVDNIVHESLSIDYSGTGTPTITVNSTTISTSGADVDITVDLATYPTISEVVAYINDQSDFTSTVLTSDDTEASTELDAVTAEAIVAGSWALSSTIQEIMDVIAANVRIESAELATSATRIAPDLDTDYVYFTGGTKGDFTATEWTASLVVLEAEDVQLVMGVVSDSGIHALIKNHCEAMNAVTGKAERLFILGCAEGESVDQAIARASALSSDSGALCYRDFTGYDINGNLRSFGSVYFAAKVLGMFTVLDLPEPATAKNVDCVAWTGALTNSEIESLISGGVLVGTTKRTGERIIERSLTTFQGDLLQRNEFSMRRTALYITRDTREAVERVIIGHALTNTLMGRVDSVVTGKLSGYSDLGLFNGSPPYWGYQKTINGDIITIDYSCNLTPPANFAFITSHMQVYASTS